jgi:hypothetical protein
LQVEIGAGDDQLRHPTRVVGLRSRVQRRATIPIDDIDIGDLGVS